jgi:MFS family permease
LVEGGQSGRIQRDHPLGGEFAEGNFQPGTGGPVVIDAPQFQIGSLAAAFATARPSLVTATVAALLLGVGYGVCLIVGLDEVEQLAAPNELGAVVALYYSLAYAGLAVPYLLALAAPHIGYPNALLITAGAAVLTLIVVHVNGRNQARPRSAGRE